MQYVLLLRGINVGGNNIIKMAELRTCLEGCGFSNVRTYIQSGNVVFSAPRTAIDALTTKIAKALKKYFNYTNPILVVTATQYKQAVDQAPRGFGSKPDSYRYDVIFLIPPLTANAAMADIPLREGVDTVDSGQRALYFRRVKGQESKSKLGKLVQLKAYQLVTIRNWNTTKKIQALLDV